ncbi:205 kDa microtubule-associated protein [Stomoxys calcitrans]|uniref:205 kDa microtubule-associated protein n=1 Tax=Stomoxys calcitrans TaxID=35570 RepID=UPI0027E2F592|nr:205 kDa microtubule-associated protein [Stomoxys calcitrans]XP_013107793.2 205 kDa microtubule-associated protein [Stomoxys calcitrans]
MEDQEILEQILEHRQQQSYVIDNMNAVAGCGDVGSGSGDISVAKYDEQLQTEDHDVGDDDELKYVKEVQQSEKHQTCGKVFDGDGEYNSNELAENEEAKYKHVTGGNGSAEEMGNVKEISECSLDSLPITYSNGHEINKEIGVVNIHSNNLLSSVSLEQNQGDSNEQKETVDDEEGISSYSNGTSSLSENAAHNALGDFKLLTTENQNKEESICLEEASHPHTTEQGTDQALFLLNPDAKEFVPTSPTSPTLPNIPKLQNDHFGDDLYEHHSALAIPRRIINEDDFVAQSPRKGICGSMEAIAVPPEQEFDEEADKRPHELAQDNIDPFDIEADSHAKLAVMASEEICDNAAIKPNEASTDDEKINVIDHGPETSVDLCVDISNIKYDDPATTDNDVMKQSIYISNDDPIEDVLNSVQLIPEIDSINNSFIEDLNSSESAGDKEQLQVEEKELVSKSPSTEEMNTHAFPTSSNNDFSINTLLFDSTAMQGSIYVESESQKEDHNQEPKNIEDHFSQIKEIAPTHITTVADIESLKDNSIAVDDKCDVINNPEHFANINYEPKQEHVENVKCEGNELEIGDFLSEPIDENIPALSDTLLNAELGENAVDKCVENPVRGTEVVNETITDVKVSCEIHISEEMADELLKVSDGNPEHNDVNIQTINFTNDESKPEAIDDASSTVASVESSERAEDTNNENAEIAENVLVGGNEANHLVDIGKENNIKVSMLENLEKVEETNNLNMIEQKDELEIPENNSSLEINTDNLEKVESTKTLVIEEPKHELEITENKTSLKNNIDIVTETATEMICGSESSLNNKGGTNLKTKQSDGVKKTGTKNAQTSAPKSKLTTSSASVRKLVAAESIQKQISIASKPKLSTAPGNKTDTSEKKLDKPTTASASTARKPIGNTSSTNKTASKLLASTANRTTASVTKTIAPKPTANGRTISSATTTTRKPIPAPINGATKPRPASSTQSTATKPTLGTSLSANSTIRSKITSPREPFSSQTRPSVKSPIKTTSNSVSKPAPSTVGNRSKTTSSANTTISAKQFIARPAPKFTSISTSATNRRLTVGTTTTTAQATSKSTSNTLSQRKSSPIKPPLSKTATKTTNTSSGAKSAKPLTSTNSTESKSNGDTSTSVLSAEGEQSNTKNTVSNIDDVSILATDYSSSMQMDLASV